MTLITKDKKETREGMPEIKAREDRESTEGKTAKQAMNTIQLVVFRLGDEEYALRIDDIKEVVLTPKVTPVPQVPAYIKGVANIRGNILAIVDLEERYGMHKGNVEPGKFTLVIDDPEFKVGILVRNVPNTISITPDILDESSHIIHDSSLDGNAVEAIAKLEDRLVFLFDIRRLLKNEEFFLAPEV